MSLGTIIHDAANLDALDVIEGVLDGAGFPYERDEDEAVQCGVNTRWGEMGGLFARRDAPPAVHVSITLDVKVQSARKTQIAQLIMMANERLWLGHFDYWQEEGVIMFRHALPLLDREAPTQGEIKAVLLAATEGIDRFVPAFNFVIWAGKTPEEAIEAAMFETAGEA